MPTKENWLIGTAGRWSELPDAHGAWVDACLTKPVRQSQLLNAMADTWAKRIDEKGPEPVARKGSPVAVGSRPAGRFSGLPVRVLVAEDNVVNQKVAVRMLANLGIRADVAGNGLEAVQLVSSLPYDLVFMDCHMPEMDGYVATQQIRHLEKPGTRLVIAAMTAEAVSGARDECLAAGMDDYLSKPVKLEDLSRVLAKWIVVSEPRP